MSYSDRIQLCFVDHTQLHSPTLLAALTNALIHDGFRLALFDTNQGSTDQESHLWHAHLYNHANPDYQALPPERKFQLEQSGMTPLLQQALQDFASNKLSELSIEALGVSPETAELRFYISVLNDIEETNAGALHPIVSRNERTTSYWFKRLPNLLYSVLHPDYAYLLTSYDQVFFSSDIQQGKLPYLYVDNYFGPALVAKIGREQLRTTPSAIVRELSDGGLFVRIERDIKAACQHLGLISQADAK